MRRWIFLAALLFFTKKVIYGQINTTEDSLCTFLVQKLPSFPEIKSISNNHILINQLIKTTNKKDSVLFILATNRELVRTRHSLTYSNNCSQNLTYLAVYRTKNSYSVQQYKNLQDALQTRAPTDENIIYVHGYGRTFSSILEESEKIQRFYNVPLIVFDWPSKYPGIFELKSYLYSKRNLKESQKHFVQFIKEYQHYVKSDKSNETIHSSLIMHSMGNTFLEQSIKHKQLDEIEENLFDKVVLNAAAIRKNGHSKWLMNIHITSEVYVISNNNDPTLYGVYWLTLKKQLGRSRIKKQVEGIHYVHLGHIASGHHDYFLNKDLMQQYPELKILYFRLLTQKSQQTLEECPVQFLTKKEAQE
jgi:hypothetical protein